jgi:hypothetical protein
VDDASRCPPTASTVALCSTPLCRLPPAATRSVRAPGAWQTGTTHHRPTTAASRDRQTKRHSTYRSSFVIVAYRWHPLFGKRLRLIRRAGHGDAAVIHVEVDSKLSCELPAWMCDASVCAAMQLGPPQVAIHALNELRAVLTAARTLDAGLGGSLNSSQKEGKSDEAIQQRITKAARARAPVRAQTSTSRAHTRGTGAGPRRSSAAGARRGRSRPTRKRTGRRR